MRKAAELTVIGLHHNQHRAVDAAGIASSNGRFLFRERGQDIARNAFTPEMLERLQGKSAIGHIRYATSGEGAESLKYDNVQPILGMFHGTPFALAHNGNLTNTADLELIVPTDERVTTMDSEFIVRLLEREPNRDIERAFVRVLGMLRGSFELLLLFPDRLVAVRDPQGNHPLSIGCVDGAYVISSETCAYPSVGAQYMYDIDPGTFISIQEGGAPRVVRFAPPTHRQCVFELIYYAHPASFVFGKSVGRFRQRLGARLEADLGVPHADIVVGVPDSSNFIAMGFGASGRSGDYYPAINRHHYVGRTFIAATQAMRDAEVASKFTFSAEEVNGKTVVLIDDSIVRGTTLRKVIGVMRLLGARAVHVRIASPPFRHPCTYGINTKSYGELIANQKTVDGIRDDIGADSLAYLSLESLQQAVETPHHYCFSCMTGQYW